MKVNFKQSFKDYKGNEVKTNGVSVIISDEIGKILFNLGTSGNAPLTPDEKYLAYKLCGKVCQSSECELTVEESAFIIKVCGEHLTAGAYGQIRDLIENS